MSFETDDFMRNLDPVLKEKIQNLITNAWNEASEKTFNKTWNEASEKTFNETWNEAWIEANETYANATVRMCFLYYNFNIFLNVFCGVI